MGRTYSSNPANWSLDELDEFELPDVFELDELEACEFEGGYPFREYDSEE